MGQNILAEFNLNRFNLLSFSSANSIADVFNLFYNILVDKWKIVELDLFILDENNNMFRMSDISASVTLGNIYNELEERGLLDFASNTNEIKIIPNIDDTIEQINSIIIIPISLFNKTAAYFIANTALAPNEIDNSYTDTIHFIAEHSFALISIHKNNIDNNIENKKHNLLKQQLLIASNQITISELITALNNGLETYCKIIKTNLDLIQKKIGDEQKRMKIVNEQFDYIIATQNKIQELSHKIENIPAKHNIISIIEEVISISNPILNKFGITLSVNSNNNENKNININCFRIQIIFAIYTFIAKSIEFMQDGGIINIGLFVNDNNTISIIIADDGNGIVNDEINGNIILELDLSPQKMKSHFLYSLAQHIITSHKGKLSVYTEDNKGTTHKIIFPIAF